MEEDGPFQATSQTVAQIGISIEPIAAVMAMQAASQAATSNQLVLRSSVTDSTQLALKLLESNPSLIRFLQLLHFLLLDTPCQCDGVVLDAQYAEYVHSPQSNAFSCRHFRTGIRISFTRQRMIPV
jgi:hypothetical protein